jgi:hypothetical protein
MKHFIAYHGSEFIIEWYHDSEGQSAVLDYFLDLSPERQDKVLRLFKAMGDRGVINNITKFRNEGNGIYAFKPQPDRFLCFFYKGKKVVITNAFVKKQDKLPVSEKERALHRKQNYEKRIEEGTYYGS